MTKLRKFWIVSALLAVVALGTTFAAQVAPAPEPQQPVLKTAFVKHLGKNVKFRHRDSMTRRASPHAFRLPGASLPPTVLPVDWTNGGAVSCPMDDNDSEGDCGLAMACHADNILTYGRGLPGWTESTFSTSAISSQYLRVSGGDNGLDEQEVVDQIWMVGIAGNNKAICVDSLDIDVTNVSLARFAINNFGTIQMAWSVPDNFLNQWTSGSSWLTPAVPDPNNGHYTPLTDIDASGNYRLYTWGGWSWVSPSFVASVQPQCFISFSPRQFSTATGLDCMGRHISAQAALWVQCGGSPISPSVIASFPPLVAPTPTPVPTPTPTPTPVQPVRIYTTNDSGTGLQISVDFDHKVIAVPTPSQWTIIPVPASLKQWPKFKKAG